MAYYDITSLRRIARYQFPKTYTDALSYLQWRRETVQLLAIHRRYIGEPLEGADEQERVLPDNESSYSEVERACLMDIDRLFPFAIDYLLMGADEGERHRTIPLFPCGVDIWERPLSDHEPGWQILIALVARVEIEEEGLEALEGKVLAVLAQVRKGVVSLQRLEHLCQAEEEPLHALPTAARIIAHDTNNAFLDPTDEMPCEDMFWDLEDVALLVLHWKEAQAMTTQTDALAAWLAADVAHVRKAVKLWNRSLIAAKRQPQS